jgi:uncharacterized protein YacL
MTIFILILQILMLGMVSVLFWRQWRGRTVSSKAVILDSCALIDGRIVELARAGFVPETIIIPRFILLELQYLADGPDSHKRERARFGLDIARELGDIHYVTRVIDQTDPGVETVDQKLVALAQSRKAKLYTTDYNLLKVAEVEGVRVLNVNELAQNIRPIFLPGEPMKLKIVQKGSNSGQGVGFASDGTMVVVDGALKSMGKEVDVVVDRMLNTPAGKMIFAKLVKPKDFQAKVGAKTKAPPRSPKYIQDLARELA